MALLTVEQLRITARVGRSSRVIAENISFSVDRGERLAVTGESGIGKTMTANAILGLLPANCAATGLLSLDGQNLLALPTKARRAMLGRSIVLVPQSGADSLTPSITVGWQTREVLRRQGIRGRTALDTRAGELFDAVGLRWEELRGSYPFQLSGGMAQRVVMALGMAGSPTLVIADEPTRGIDAETEQLFLDSLEAAFAGAAVLLITHSPAVTARCTHAYALPARKEATP